MAGAMRGVSLSDKPNLKSLHRVTTLSSASFCPGMWSPISALENILELPRLARPRRCSAPISVRYPAVEAADRRISVVARVQFGSHRRGHSSRCSFVWACSIALAFIDADTHLCPTTSHCRCYGWGFMVNAFGVHLAARCSGGGRRIFDLVAGVLGFKPLPARTVWAMEISNCLPPWGPALDGKCCPSSSCFRPLWSVGRHCGIIFLARKGAKLPWPLFGSGRVYRTPLGQGH